MDLIFLKGFWLLGPHGRREDGPTCGAFGRQTLSHVDSVAPPAIPVLKKRIEFPLFLGTRSRTRRFMTDEVTRIQ